MSLSILSPREVAIELARRMRQRRLARGWTQAELAERSGVALSTLKLFEHKGHIALDRLLRIAATLDELDAFRLLFPPPQARSLDEIEARDAGPVRKHGRRRDAR
jgi:transcriptional regulator with XRE-family HTH domain